MAQMEDRWLSVGDVCIYFGVSNDTVYRWTAKQDISTHCVDRL